MDSIGDLIKAAREELGLSQAELARRSGIDVSSLNRLERRRLRPRVRTLERLAEGLGLTRNDPKVKDWFAAMNQPATVWPWGEETKKEREPVGSFLDALGQRGLGFVEPSAGETGDSLRSVFRDTEDALQAAIALLEAAPSLPSPGSDNILITFQGKEDAFDRYHELREDWKSAVKGAMKRGWNVFQLIRLEDDPGKRLAVVEDLTGILGGYENYGEFRPWCFSTYGGLTPVYDLLVVPRTGGMLFLSTMTDSSVDSAFFYPPGEHLDVLSAHWWRLKRQTKPLLKTYRPDTHAFDEELAKARREQEYYLGVSLAFSDAIASAYQYEGNRFLFMGGLGQNTYPIALDRERARPILDRGDEKAKVLRQLLDIEEKREEGFFEHLKSNRCLDICPKSAVRRLVTERVPARDSSIDYLGVQPLTPRHVTEHLRYLISMLREYPNYELGLLEDLDQPYSPEVWWAVKQGHSVFLEAWQPDGHGGKMEVDLEISEPALVKAFGEYFLHLWDGNAPRPLVTDKDEVIDWLEGQVKLLR